MNIIRSVKNGIFRICLPVFFFFSPFLSYSQEKIYGLLYTDMMPVSVTIRDGLIKDVKRMNKLPKGSQPLIIAPGFIDNQVNGFAGVSFCSPGSDLTAEGIRKATYSLWKTGVTTYIPVLSTNDPELIRKNLVILSHMKDDRVILGSIPGFHLEGPYLSPIDGFRGEHPLKYIRTPEWDKFLEIYEYSRRNILQVTIAPELAGGMEFIDRCRSKGIVVALGHHNASADIISEAVDHGAQIAIHLGKGLAKSIDKQKNPLWPQLSDDRLLISLTCDKFSLTPEEVKVFFKVKGADRIIITSDVTSFAMLPPGEYTTDAGDKVELTDDGMLRYMDNTLYGSASPLKDGVSNIMRITKCSLVDAIKMASTNPATLYGLHDRGVIEEGKRADLIMFQLINSDIIINKTYVNGNLVFDASPERR